nr:hypothetical protein CFP56_78620 [Quercus suber]
MKGVRIPAWTLGDGGDRRRAQSGRQAKEREQEARHQPRGVDGLVFGFELDFSSLAEIAQKDLRVRVFELRGAAAEAALGPFLVPVFALEQADEESVALVDALTGVFGFFVGGLGRHLFFGDLRIGLKDDGVLGFLEHHGEAQHDAKGRQPGGFAFDAGVQGLLLPVEDVVVDGAAQDAEEELELAVGQAGGGERLLRLRDACAVDGVDDGKEVVVFDGEGVTHDVGDGHHPDDLLEKYLQLHVGVRSILMHR